jgi:hypothetical protein
VFSFWRRRLLRQTWHPSFEEIVQFLGEPDSRSDKMEAHLRTCWSCRATREQVDRVTSAYMEARSASLAGSTAFPNEALPAFERKLGQLALESGSPRSFAAFLRERAQAFLPAPYRFGLVAFLGSIVLTVIALRLVSVPPVSAKRVLYQVRQAEADRLQRTPLPVIHEKLQLGRHSKSDSSKALAWEIWRDTGGKRFRHRVEDPQGARLLTLNSRRNTRAIEPVPQVFAELEHVYTSHAANFEQPLSADNFEAFSLAIQGPSEHVFQRNLSDGNTAFVLRSSGEGPFVQNGIMSVELTVRRRDWQAVEGRLEVNTAGGPTTYTIREIAMEAIPLEAVRASVFDEPAASLPAAPLTAPSVEERVLLELSPALEQLPAEDDLVASEVEVRYSFHSMGACLGRPITVARIGRSGVEVQGVVEDEESKRRLRDALKGIPHVTYSIRTAAEDRAAAVTEGTPLEIDVTAPSEALPRKLAAEPLLKQFFAAGDCAAVTAEEKSKCIQQNIAQLSQDVLMQSDALLAQGWELRRLAEWYSSLPPDGLRTSSRRLVELMVREHLASLRQAWEQTRTRVSATLGPHSPEPGDAADSLNGPWTTTSQRICTAVERTANLMLALFVETNRSPTEPEAAIKDLRSEMARLDVALAKLEADLRSNFFVPR